jgi:DNA-binding SARP family transcriptional activator/DNA-binding CsgD family transcriptional regulator
VRRDELAAAVWFDLAPGSVDPLLTSLLSRMRAALPDGMVGGRGQLQLELGPDAWIDVEAVAAAQGAADRLLASDPRAALAEARAALAILGLPLLPEADPPWIEEARRALEIHRPGLLEIAARAALEAGDPAAAEAAARSLVDQEPYRESAHGLLMEVHAARGDVAEALRAYDRLRTLLREELGTAPAPPVRAIAERLLNATDPQPVQVERATPRPAGAAGMELPDALHRASPAELKARIAAERADRPFLLFTDSEGAQRIVDLPPDAGRVTVGRGEACDVSLHWDREASRVHALLERLHDEWTVDDGGSRNGSFVNGERLSRRRRLRDGDVVRIGRTLLVFRAPSGSESVQTLPAEDAEAPELTPAQHKVLVQVCRPFAASTYAAPASTRQIAEELVISPDTVKTHLRALFDAFGVEALPQNQKRAELARRALELGVVNRAELER